MGDGFGAILKLFHVNQKVYHYKEINNIIIIKEVKLFLEVV